MPAGDTFQGRFQELKDPFSGVVVRQLTDLLAHTNHLYFTNNGLWDGGRRLLIVSDRGNAPNYHSLDLRDGTWTQITDFGGGASPALQSGFVNPVRPEVCFFHDRVLCAVDLRTFARRELHRVPEGFVHGNLSITADGRTVCFVQREDLSQRFRIDLSHGYVGFRETYEARPHCQVFAVPVDTGGPRLLHEDRCWIGHINTSPTQADWLTFCHEGPWRQVRQRMWLLEIGAGRVRPLRVQQPGECVGHEYWFADGRRVGYHGHAPGKAFFGHVEAATGQVHEWDFPFGSIHFHSLDETLVVGDGDHQRRHLMLWSLRGDQYAGPRLLVNHRGSWHVQRLHVHPRLFLDGGQARVVYTADPQGYGQVYVVDVPPFDQLPEVPANP